MSQTEQKEAVPLWMAFALVTGFVLVLLLAVVVTVLVMRSNLNDQAKKVVSVTETITQSQEITTISESELDKMLDLKLSGLIVGSVHDIVIEEVGKIAKQQGEWSEEDLLIALRIVVDKGIAQWLESEIKAIAKGVGVDLTASQIRDYRDRLYTNDWLPFMLYYEIAYLKGKGLKVKS